jgi:hypothetical protein
MKKTVYCLIEYSDNKATLLDYYEDRKTADLACSANNRTSTFSSNYYRVVEGELSEHNNKVSLNEVLLYLHT